MRKVTIKDVAMEAGVSISTVSNAINDVDVLNPDTKKHILEIAKRLNYVPNLNGKLLKSGQTKMLGFFTTSLSGPYFYTLVDTMSRECEKKGYGLNVFVTKNKEIIRNNIFGGRVDGVIIFEEEQISDKDIVRMEKNKIKAVFLDRILSNDSMGSIVFDSYVAGYEATKYLINLGHKRIAYLSGVDSMFDSVQRRDGYLAALDEYQLPIDPDYIIQGYFEEEGSYNAVKSLIKRFPDHMPDAFLAGNDLSAIGCIRALQSEGYHVPKEVSVVGFDDIDIAQYFKPSLTTVRNPIKKQAIMVIEHLIKLIGHEEKGKIEKLPGEIIVRNSSYIKT